MLIKADLHLHSCLSPCGSLDMSPRRIVAEAKKRGLGLIALTDHNTARNCQTFAAICEKEKINCIYGLEVMTREEVHSLCYFESLGKVMEFDKYIFELLPDIRNFPEKFGDQVIVNEDEEIIGTIEKYLGVAAELSIDELKEKVLSDGGLFVPAHVDRKSFSLTSQLGFVPLHEKYSAVEVKGDRSVSKKLYGYPVLTSSDAHYPEQIGSRYTELELKDFSFAEIKKAIANL